MHEAVVAQSIIDAVQRWDGERNGGGRVTGVVVRIGKMTCIIPDNLRFIFSVLIRDTALEGARLQIEESPVHGRCRSCGADFDIVEPSFTCLHCRSGEVEIESGTELLIEAVEVE